MKALTRSDEALLCGRGGMAREIAANCRAERFTVLTAEPGLGVTSLLEAGVAPLLRREGFVVASFREWQGRAFAAGLKESIAEAIRQDADPLFHCAGEPLEELLERGRRLRQKPVVVLLDQFEDYLRCHANSHEADLFDAELARAVAGRGGVFVIGMQEHALPVFERFGQHISNLLGFHVRLAPLTLEEAAELVRAEARAKRFEVEPAALDALTSAPAVQIHAGPVKGKRKGEIGIHPFFLKMAVEALADAEMRLASPVLRAETIDGHGGADRLALESFDATLGDLNETHRELLFRWCNILISPDCHRLSVTEKGLTDYAGKLNRFVPPLLQRLTDTGILRLVETPEAARYEIARECLTFILRDWWERREAAIVARRRAAFRVRSITVAASAIALMYIFWLFFGVKPGPK